MSDTDTENNQSQNTKETESSHGDLQTNLGALREFLTMEFNTLYSLLATLELLFPSKKKTPLGYSLVSTVISTILSTVIAYGSAVIQHAIDKKSEKVTKFTSENLHSARSKGNEELCKRFINYFTDSDRLTLMQILQLTGAKTGQSFDLGGFAIGMLNTSASFSTITKIILTSSIFAAGVVAAEATIRPGRNIMEFDNGKLENIRHGKEDPNGKADKWTLAFILAKLLKTLIANIVFYATLADKMNGYKPNTPFNVSTQGILDMLVPIIYVTFSVVFFQYFICVMNRKYCRPHEQANRDIELVQVGTNTDDKPEMQPITFCEKAFITFLLIGRMLGTATDCSVPPLTFLSEYLSPGAYVGIAFGATVAGMGVSTSDWRTSQINWDKYREKNAPWIDALVEGLHKKTSRFSSNTAILFRSICPCPQPPDNDLRKNLVSGQVG